MKLLVISPGKAHAPEIAEGIAEYQKRLGRKFSLEWATPPAGTKEAERAAILKLLREGDFVVLLDERGKETTTPQFAELLGKHLREGTKRLVFIIGGAYGADEELRKKAHLLLRLSALTFPHMLVRLILAEQLYRAQSILEGGKYHH